MPLSPPDLVTGIDVFGDVPVKVEVRIGCRFTLEEIATLFGQSSTFPLNKPAGEKLDIFAGDLTVAGGEVLAIDDHLAIRITDLLPGPENGRAAEARAERSAEVPQRVSDEGLAAKIDLPQAVAGMSLGIHVVLGSTTLPLQEIFRWAVGSVIKLDQRVTEPADVVVNGRVLARGQMMLLGGNYGLRVLPK